MTRVIPFVANIGTGSAKGWVKALQVHFESELIVPYAQLEPAVRAEAEFAIVANPDPAEIAAMPSLKWVQSLWAGVERLVAELPDKSVRIVRLVDPQMADTMAEAVLAWTLYLHRDMPRYRAQQQARIWLEHELKLPSQSTIGLLGLGALGTRCAQVLSSHGFEVCGWTRKSSEIDDVETFHGSKGLPSILSRSDYLVCLLPLTTQTRGLLDLDNLAHLPRGAAVINFSRGPILETGALLELLDSGHLSHAVLDVFDEEPLPSDSPLWAHPAITVLPHISAPTNRQTASAIAAANVRRFLETGEIPESVNREQGY